MAVMLGTSAFAVTERSFARVAQAAELPPKEPADDDESSINIPYSWSIAEQYESMRAGMAVEEKRAFSARLFIVWTFFVAFWMVCFLDGLSSTAEQLLSLRRSDLEFSV
jgi:hypothetical protein